ncbi:MAG: AAA family ATPase, partial [Thermoplasmata archaeon]|nr:AAA family ATPase [Thermoplasmata archaeon]
MGVQGEFFIPSKKKKRSFKPGIEEEALAQVIEDIPFAAREMRRIAPTADEKVLLHLVRFGKFQDQWDVPFAVTQTGISRATSILRNNIPRTMQNLINRGFVQKKTIHVRGTIRRRIVYFLTTEGLKKAKDLEGALQDTFIILKKTDGAVDEAKIGDIYEYLPEIPETTPLLEFVLHLSKDGVFDCRTFKARTVEKEEGFVDFSVHVPKLKYFFDRKNEMDSISKWLLSDTSKMLVVYGMAGCGKTTLASKVVETVKKKMNVYWYQFHEWDTIRNLLGSLSKFLSQIGRRELKQYLSANKGVDLNEALDILETQLQDGNALLVFDDFQKTNEHLYSFSLALRERLERIEGIKLIVIGRDIKPFYDSRETVIKKLVTELHLG